MDEWRATIQAMQSEGFKEPEPPSNNRSSRARGGGRGGSGAGIWNQRGDNSSRNQQQNANKNQGNQNRRNEGGRNPDMGGQQQNVNKNQGNQNRRDEGGWNSDMGSHGSQPQDRTRISQHAGMSQVDFYQSLKKNTIPSRNNDIDPEGYYDEYANQNIDAVMNDINSMRKLQQTGMLGQGMDMMNQGPVSMNMNDSSLGMAPGMMNSQGRMGMMNRMNDGSGMMNRMNEGPGMMNMMGPGMTNMSLGKNNMNNTGVGMNSSPMMTSVLNMMNSIPGMQEGKVDSFILINQARELISDVKGMIELDDRNSNDPETREVLKLISFKERELNQREERLHRENFVDESSLFSRKSELEFGTRIETKKRPTLLGGPPFPNVDAIEQFELNNTFNTPEFVRDTTMSDLRGSHNEPSLFAWDNSVDRMSGGRNELDYGVAGGSRGASRDRDRKGEGRLKGRLPDLKTELKTDLKREIEGRRGGGRTRGGDVGGNKHEMDIREFDWRGLNPEEFDHIPPRFLYCYDCNVKLDNGQSYVNHMGGKKHMTALVEIQTKSNELKNEMRQQIGKHEAFRAKDASSREEKNRCNLCETMVVGPLAHHRSKPHHKALKLFVHPFCPVCTLELHNRQDWEFHRFSSQHLMLVAQENRKGKITLAKDEDFMKELENLKKSNKQRESEKKEGRSKDSSKDRKRENSGRRDDKKKDENKSDDKKTDEKKSDDKKKVESKKDVKEDDDDIQEITIIKKDDKPTIIKQDEKGSLPTNLDIGDYETYNEEKVVGADFLRPVSGFFCRVCKKLLLTQEDSVAHMKTKPHWDLCVKADKVAKAVASKRKVAATGTDEPVGKVAKKS